MFKRVSDEGSPPPMRGKAARNRIRLWRRRITPAYAGKSFGDYLIDNDIKDHPRLCGEKLAFAYPRTFAIGSPPPMRGKVIEACRKYNADRITPAYAGKSARVSILSGSAGDHPRLCGEKRQVRGEEKR